MTPSPLFIVPAVLLLSLWSLLSLTSLVHFSAAQAPSRRAWGPAHPLVDFTILPVYPPPAEQTPVGGGDDELQAGFVVLGRSGRGLRRGALRSAAGAAGAGGPGGASAGGGDESGLRAPAAPAQPVSVRQVGVRGPPRAIPPGGVLRGLASRQAAPAHRPHRGRPRRRSPHAVLDHLHPRHSQHGRHLLLAGRLSLDVRAGRGAREE